MEKAMTMAATSGPGAPIRSDVVACIAHLRAFAIMLAGDHRRADDLVYDTIAQTFGAANWPPTGVDLKLQMFAVLHRLHYGTLRPSTDGSPQQRESPSSKEEGLESDQPLRIFCRLRDERREALILTIASGLSYQQAAEVCGCRIAVIKSRVLEAWLEISRALASP
jgi:RNA polymerase sigma-70 factor, ECF subfamily